MMALKLRTSVVFFLRIPRPQRSTLFPYTTLFRSRHRGAAACPGRDVARGTRGAPEARSGDRKSTRLNSSHVSISYAVFGLKKQNSHFDPFAAPRTDLIGSLEEREDGGR